MPNTIGATQLDPDLIREVEELRARVQELEDSELQRVTEEQDRFDSLQVLDEYAKQLEESRDKLMRLFKAAADVQEAKLVHEALEKVATAVKNAGWGSVSVSLYDNFEIIQSAYAGCTPSDIEFLETHRRPGAERARMYGPDFENFKVSRSYFVPADSVAKLMPLENICPGRREVQPGDEWDPMDLAYVPLYGTHEAIIGCINCDDPVNGKRPTREEFFYLELFAQLVAHKVETARLTEQKLITEAALRESEAHYRTVFSCSGDSFFVLDHIFRDCNEKACELFGCTREDIIGSVPAEHSPKYQPDGRLSNVAAEEYINKALSGAPQTFPWTHKRKDGTLIDCEVSLTSIRIGSANLLFAVVRDETERRRAENAVRQSEEHFRSLFESSPIGMTITASDGRFQNVNSAICQMLGYDNLELIGKSFAEVTHPDDVEGSFNVMQRLLSGELDNINIEKRYLHKNGESIWASVNVSAQHDVVRGSVCFVAQMQDITERKRAELERETIVRILQIVNAASEPDEMIDQIFAEVGRLVPAGNRFLALYDAQREVISFPYFVDEMDLPPPEVPLGKGLTSWVIRNAKALRLGRQDFERIIKSGEIELLGSTAFAWLGVPLIANSGVVGALVVQSYSSTGSFDADHERILSAVASQIASVIERQRVEKDLMKLKRAVQTSADVIFMTDREGIITYANPEFTRLYGFSANEIVGKQTPRVLKSGLVPPAAYEEVWQKLTRGEKIKGEIINKTKDGRFVVVEGSANPIMEDDGTIVGFLGVQHDITAQKKVQAELERKTEELETIFRALPDLYFRLDQKGKIIDYRAGRDDDLYTTPDVFLNKMMQDVLPPDVSTKFTSALERIAETGEAVSVDYDLVINRERKSFEARIAPLPAQQQVIAVVRNVTESRRALNALKESELRFRTLSDTVPAIIWMSGAKRQFVFVNRAWEEFTGQPVDQANGEGWAAEIHPDDLQRVLDTYRAAFDRQIDFSARCRLRRNDGKYCWILFNGRPRHTASGRLVGYMGTCMDVSGFSNEGTSMI